MDRTDVLSFVADVVAAPVSTLRERRLRIRAAVGVASGSDMGLVSEALEGWRGAGRRGDGGDGP